MRVGTRTSVAQAHLTKSLSKARQSSNQLERRVSVYEEAPGFRLDPHEL
jgi:hypothetical protein